jgi:proteasome lid subunit RPN8/RPN11
MNLALYAYNNDYQPPKDRLYRVKARNGYFHGEHNYLWDALVHTQQPRKRNGLRECTEYARLTIQRKIPATLVQQALSFFATVRTNYGTEALLLVCYEPTTQHYELVAPPQATTPASVQYDAIAPPNGYVDIGTFHSHPGSAFHSATDIADETIHDGIHLIFGHVHRHTPDVVGTLSVRGRRFPIDPRDVIEYPWEYHGPWLDAIQPTGGRA